MKLKQKKIIIVAIVVALALAVAAYVLINKPQQTVVLEKPKETKSFSIPLNTQNDSNESGIVLFDGENGKTKVTIKTVNYLADVPQPAHIHGGTCEEPIEELFHIEDVLNGVSETTLDVSIEELVKKPFVVNVHKSYDEDYIYTACGAFEPVK